MPTFKRKNSFTSEEEMNDIRDALKLMAENTTFNTPSSFSINTTQYPDHLIPFVDKHMHYLMTHKDINPWQYVSNLRIMTRIK
jgi:hypothetical protein